jgi:hypothetical protein
MSMWRSAAIAVISVSCASGNTERPDARPSPHGDANSQRDAPASNDGHIADASFDDAAPPCKPPNIIHGDGKHNPSMDCMSGCHDHGFSIAGTLYAADLTTPATNATITIVDANNFSQDIIVSSNGNFFSFLPVTYPVTVSASLCPDSTAMVTHPTSGACNASGCHEPGGVQGAIHL